MISILSNTNSPSFNLAAEEYFLKNSNEEVFIVYINSPCVVIGRNQNPFEEVNLSLLNQKGIEMYRRISGGGTVYHDLGNINYSFITNGLDYLNDYQYFVNKIIKPLNEIGIPVYFEEKSHIYLDGKKISGNAQTFYKNRVLHHGTLLFDVNIDNLEHFLEPKEFINSKSIKSNRAKVANLIDYIGYNSLIHSILPEYRSFTDDEITSIKEVESKYHNWEWNYGESPRFTYTRNIDDSVLEISVRNGIMEEVFLSLKEVKQEIHSLNGLPFKIDSFIGNKDNEIVNYILNRIKTLY